MSAENDTPECPDCNGSGNVPDPYLENCRVLCWTCFGRKTCGAYKVVRAQWLAGYPYMLVDAGYHKVDWYRSQTAAEHSANMLNRGIAVIDPHAIVGCKVIAR